jgi:hypothetical protein
VKSPSEAESPTFNYVVGAHWRTGIVAVGAAS